METSTTQHLNAELIFAIFKLFDPVVTKPEPSAEERLETLTEACLQWVTRERKLQDQAYELLKDERHDRNFKQMTRSAKQNGLGTVKQILARGLVLYEGWEMDNEVAVVEMADGTVQLLGTSHGGACFKSRARIEEYIHQAELSIASLRDVLEALPAK